MSANKKTSKKGITTAVQSEAGEQPKRSISLYLFPQKKLERSQKTYKGIAIATISMLYVVILFVIFVTYNFEVMFFPK